jgi:PAS domain S-box-containing protein
VESVDGDTKSGNSQSIIGFYEDEIQSLREKLEIRQLDLEMNCRLLQEALEEIEDSRNRYAALYDFAPVGYVTLDGKGCIIEINLTGASLIGLEKSQLINVPLNVFIIKSDIKLFLDHLHRCRSTHEKVTTELSLATKHGTVIQVHILSVPHKVAGVYVDQYRTVITDVTEKKLYERELARLDRLNLVGEMAGGIAHEIRNPMTVVKGYLEFLGAKKEFERYNDRFQIMICELDRANSIITEYLTLARSKAYNAKPENLNEIIEDLIPLIETDAIKDDKNINVELEAVPNLFLEKNDIKQMILNLTRNGLEAMDAGGHLTIKTFTKGKEVILEISDRGSGIPSEHLDKMGIPFFTTKDYGTGLGLAVCYKIAARHNAAIDIQTSPAGTTFFIGFGSGV